MSRRAADRPAFNQSKNAFSSGRSKPLRFGSKTNRSTHPRTNTHVVIRVRERSDRKLHALRLNHRIQCEFTKQIPLHTDSLYSPLPSFHLSVCPHCRPCCLRSPPLLALRAEEQERKLKDAQVRAQINQRLVDSGEKERYVCLKQRISFGKHKCDTFS